MLQRLKTLFGRDSREAGEAREIPFPVPSALVVGLGNPGPRYARTRHNIGFRVVEHLAARHGGDWHREDELQSMLTRIELSGTTVALMAPQTFMNRSGESVALALRRWPSIDPTSQLIIVYDDLDLPTGRLRLRPKGGGGGHNGIGDILARVGTNEIPRLRFGIGHPGPGGAVIDWVLEPFPESEEMGVLPAAIERAADAVEAALCEGVTSAMGRFNSAPSNSTE